MEYFWVIVLAFEAFLLNRGERLIFHRTMVLFGRRWALALAATGTALHELAHWAACKLLGVPTGKVVLFKPQVNEDGSYILGYVEHGRSDPLRSSLIAIAPVLLIPPFLIALSYFLTGGMPPESLMQAPLPMTAIWLMVVFLAGQGAFPSQGDRVGILGALSLIGLAFGVYYLTDWQALSKSLAIILAPPALAAGLSLSILGFISKRRGY